MKKCVLIIPFLFLLCLIIQPINTYCESVGYRVAWASWSSTSGGTALTQLNNGYQYQGGTITGQTQYQWISYKFYPSINNTVSVGSHDYMILNYLVIQTNGNYATTYYSDLSGNITSSGTDNNVNSYQLVVRWHRNNTTGTYDVPCYDLGHSGSEIIQGSVYCPMPDIASDFVYVDFRYFANYSTTQTYNVMVGLDHYFNYHYVGNSGTGIESAINSQTTEITDSLGEVNDSLNDNSSTGADSQASSLFGNFSTPTNPLTDIITMPLQLINSATATCQPVTLWFNFDFLNAENTRWGTGKSISDKTISLPCGTTLFWENSRFLNTTGNKMENFRNVWNLLLGGPIIYGLLVLIYKEVNDALDPLNDVVISVDAEDLKARKAEKSSNIAKQKAITPPKGRGSSG